LFWIDAAHTLSVDSLEGADGLTRAVRLLLGRRMFGLKRVSLDLAVFESAEGLR
jgi:hypothetical protein